MKETIDGKEVVKCDLCKRLLNTKMYPDYHHTFRDYTVDENGKECFTERDLCDKCVAQVTITENIFNLNRYSDRVFDHLRNKGRIISDTDLELIEDIKTILREIFKTDLEDLYEGHN